MTDTDRDDLLFAADFISWKRGDHTEMGEDEANRIEALLRRLARIHAAPEDVVERVARALWDEWGQWEVRVCKENMLEIALAAMSAIPTLDVTERLRQAVHDLLPLAAVPARQEAAQLSAMERDDQPVAEIIARAQAALSAIPIPAPTGEVEQTRLQMLTKKAVRYSEALAAIMEVGGEINPSNYNHEDVCALNGSYIEMFLIAEAALSDHTTKDDE